MFDISILLFIIYVHKWFTPTPLNVIIKVLNTCLGIGTPLNIYSKWKTREY